MEVLAFTVINKEIECDIKQVVGDNDYQASFMLDDAWNDKEVKCRVVWNDTTSLDIDLEDSSCVIPSYMMKFGKVSIGVFADNDEQLSTEPWVIGVRKSIREKEFSTAIPNKSAWEKINEKVKDVVKNSEFDSKVEKYLEENPIESGLSEEQVAAKINDYLAENPVTATSVDKLAGKKILCIGDSLMAGNGWEGGYANCIKENHPTVEITNIAVSGAKIIGGEIFGQVTDYYVAGNTSPDIIIFDGGGNDFMNRSTLGTGKLDSSFTNGTSDTTCDALETMINGVKTVYPFTKLLYISTPPMQQWDDGNVVVGVPTPSVQREYLDAIEKVLAKWSIPIADIYRNGNVTSMNASQLGEFFMSGDTVHLNEAGYRQVSSVVEDALNKLF